MDSSIGARDIIGRDPFAHLIAYFNLKPWQAALISLSVFLVYLFALPTYFGVLFPREGLERSSLVDRVNQVGFLIIHPVVMFYYVWQSDAIAGLYRIVLPLISGEKHGGGLRASRILHSTWHLWVPGVIVGGSVAYLGITFVVNYIGERWYSVNWFMAAILQMSRFLLLYMIVVVLARHMIMAINLNRVYRHVKLPVLIGQSKYGASFDAITRYGLWFAAFGGALGLFIAMRFFYTAPVFPEDAIFLAAYLVLIPLAFSLPFWQAHSNMQKAREQAVSRISDALQDEYDRLMVELASMENTEMPSERIAALRSLLELTEKAPTWPFENWTLYRVLAATVFPFIMTGLGLLLDVLI